MTLYHYSEDPTIKEFVPRAPLAYPEQEPLVWALDDWHSPLYFVPRDCPRICFWPTPTTTLKDREKWFGATSARMVMAVEWDWFERLQNTKLYRYLLPEESFEPLNDAGMYISRTPVTPLGIAPLGDLTRRLRESEVELRLCASLVPLGQSITGSSLHYSLIRMRNAAGWPQSEVGKKDDTATLIKIA